MSHFLLLFFFIWLTSTCTTCSQISVIRANDSAHRLHIKEALAYHVKFLELKVAMFRPESNSELLVIS